VSFAAPHFLVLLVAAPLAGLALALLLRWQERAGARFLGEQAAGGGRGRLLPLVKGGLLVLALALLALAAARPQIGSREVPVERRGIDVMIALDVSLSMDATDVIPSRLSGAQEAIGGLVERLAGSRVGLVLFARDAVVRSPLTTDLTVVERLVAAAEQERGLTAPGSDLGAGVDAATEALAAGETVEQAILVVSDGEDFGGQALDAVQRAAAEGIVVHVAGVGTAIGAPLLTAEIESGRVPMVEERPGEPVVTRLNEGLLRRVAAAGGGTYVNLAGAADLTPLAGKLGELEQTVFAVESQERPVERFQWFLAAGLVLVAVEVALPGALPRPGARTRRWPLLPAAVLVAFLAAGCVASVHTLNDDGNRLYEEGAFAEALEKYRQAQVERPDLPELNYNAANALHRLEDYERAVDEVLRALPIDEPDLAFRAYYSLGNDYYRLGRPSDAFAAYKQALILDPSDVDAKFNLELVGLLLAQQPPEAPAPDAADGQPPPSAQVPGSEGEGEQALPAGPEGPPGEPGADDEARQQVEQALADALAATEEELSVEQALKVLDLIRERQRLQPGLPSLSPPVPGEPDY
jgi:Ca-activated chloride channel family protein